MSQPNQPNQPNQYGQPAQPAQPNQYGQQYAQPGQPDQYGQQYGQPGQPDQYGQQYGQPGQPSQYNQPAQQGSFTLPPAEYTVPATGAAAAPVQRPGSLGKALAIGLLAVVLGALAWGGLAYLTERFFVYVAFAIGYGVSYALTVPFKKPLSKAIIVSLLVPALVLTVASVELGNYLALAFFAVKQGFTFGEGLTEAGLVFGDLITSSDGIKSALFALVGAAFGFFNMVRR